MVKERGAEQLKEFEGGDVLAVKDDATSREFWLAVKDDATSREFWLAKVTATDADELSLHYDGTTSKGIKSATYKLAHIGCRTGLTILHSNPDQRDEKTLPWTGKTSLDLVVAPVQLLAATGKGGQNLSAASKQLVPPEDGSLVSVCVLWQRAKS